QLGEALFDLVGDGVEFVAGVDGLAQGLVLALVALGLLNHAFDFATVEVGALGDGDALFLAGVPVSGLDAEYAVGVDVESGLDLRVAARRRAGGGELEAAEPPVGGGPCTRAVQDDDVEGGLVVLSGGEGLGAAYGDGGVPVDDLRQHAAACLDTQGQGC